MHAKSDLKAPVYSDTKIGLKSFKTLVILGGHLCRGLDPAGN